MRKIFLVTLIFSIFSFSGWSETLTMDDLVERGGLYYKKFTNVPFTGQVSHFENGWLNEKRTFRNGKDDGLLEWYYESGQLRGQFNYKDGELHGPSEWYYKNGQVKEKGTFIDGKEDGLSEGYYEDGQLKYKGQYKNYGTRGRRKNLR